MRYVYHATYTIYDEQLQKYRDSRGRKLFNKEKSKMAKITKWEPENEQFWRETGSGIAWRTCGITTFTLIFSFATWFVMSAVVVRLPNIGFKFTTMELFWLAVIPGPPPGVHGVL